MVVLFLHGDLVDTCVVSFDKFDRARELVEAFDPDSGGIW